MFSLRSRDSRLRAGELREAYRRRMLEVLRSGSEDSPPSKAPDRPLGPAPEMAIRCQAALAPTRMEEDHESCPGGA